MNVIKHIVITIEADIWEPFEKDAIRELGDLGVEIRSKRLLSHYGNVRIKDDQTLIKPTDRP